MTAFKTHIDGAVRWLRDFSPAHQSSGGIRSPGIHAPPDADIDQIFPAATSTRLSAAARLVSCFAATHIVLQYSLTTQKPLVLPVTVLVLFAIYVGTLYWRTVHDSASRERQITYWVDILWYLTFTGMTGGPSSNFSFFLPFPVLFVSLRWGFAPGITMAAFSSAVLLILGIFSNRTGTPTLGAEMLLPPVALLVLGYLIATWANSGLALNRRLASLKEINSLFNPRLNIEQIIDRVVRQFAQPYRVDKYILAVVQDGRPPRAFRANLPDRMYRVSDTAATELTTVMSKLAATGTVVYHHSQGLRRADSHDLSGQNVAASTEHATDAAALANRLDCAGFCSVPFNLRHGGTAQLLVCSNEYPFGLEDLPFFRQLGEQLSPRIENVQLLDRLASEVADHERQKISRDIHDSAIQPYIGLKFGLEALARKVAPEDPLSKDIGRLVEMTNSEITELRRYVKGLRGDGEPGHAALVPAVRRQATRFGELYGIKVVVESAGELRVGDDLAGEAFHMVGEALSNIRRHTTAAHAHINLHCDMQNLTLRIANPCDAGISAKSFTPRSIAERAHALGGVCRVENVSGGDTVVTVEIPLRH